MREVRVSYDVSERRACGVLRIARSTVLYQSVADDRAEIRVRLRDMASARPRYGYRRLQILLEREGY